MLKEAIGRVRTSVKLLTKSDLDAMDLLRSDHMKMEAMLLQLRFVRDKRYRTKLFRQIRSDLEKHMELEERIFYPAVSEIDEELVERSFEEHMKVKQLLSQIAKVDAESDEYSSLVTELIMNIEDHVMDEEDQLFPEVQKKMDPAKLKKLNRAMIQAHESPQLMIGRRVLSPRQPRRKTQSRGRKSSRRRAA